MSSRAFPIQDIRIRVPLRVSAERVYQALTSTEELRRWWSPNSEAQARNGGRLRLGPSAQAGPGEAGGVFVDLDPGRKVAWIWEERLQAGGVPGLVSLFLEPQESGCEATLLHAGFPAQEVGASLLARWRGYWEDFLAKLRTYLEADKRRGGKRG